MTIVYTSAKRAVYQFDLAVFKILTDWDISLDPFGNKHFSTAWTTLDFLMDFRLNKSGLFNFYDAVIYSGIVASLCIPIIGIVFVNDEFSIFSVLSTSTAISNAHLVTSLICVLVIIILRILIIVEIIVVVIVEIVSVNVILCAVFI